MQKVSLGACWWSMDGWRAFVRAMRGTDDPQLAMVAADWLDDEGQVAPWADAAAARAELIRWQCDGDAAALPADFTAFRLAGLPEADDEQLWLYYGRVEDASSGIGHVMGAFHPAPGPDDPTGWAWAVLGAGAGDPRLQGLLRRITVGHLADARRLRFRNGQLVEAGFPAWRYNLHAVGPAVACEPLRSVECLYTYPVPWSGGAEWNRPGPERDGGGTLGPAFRTDAHDYLQPPGQEPPPGGHGREAMAWSDRRAERQRAYADLLYRRAGRQLLHPACYIDTPGVVPAPVWAELGGRHRYPSAAVALVHLDRAARTCAVKWANRLTGERTRYLEPDVWTDPGRGAARAGWEGRLWRAAVGPSAANLLGILPEDLPVTRHTAGRRGGSRV